MRRRSGRRRRLSVLCAALLFTFACSAPHSFAKGYYRTSTIELGSKQMVQSLEMWHYSGGYWKVGNDYTTAIKVADRDIDNASNITGYLQSTQLVSFRVELPKSWREKLLPGDRVYFVPSSGSVPMKQIFDTSSFTGYYSEPYYYVQVKPKFVLSKGNSFDRYVSGMRVSIPLIHHKYGENLYAIYRGAASKGAGSGWFSESNSSATMTPHIHPTMIKNSSGAFKAGYTINNLIGSLQSNGYSVGNGTFANGGAVGIKFNFSLNMLFKAERTEWIEGVAAEPGISPPGGGSGSSGGGGSSPGGSGGSGGGGSGSIVPEAPEVPFSPDKWRIHRVR